MYRYLVAALALALFSTSAAHANAFGATPYTLRDNAASCGGCHGNSNPALNVSFTGPNVMLPGATQVWTATITGTGVNLLAGFAAAIQKPAMNAATFSSIAGQPTVTGDGMTQISHGSGQGALDNFSGGMAQYTVNLTVPAGAALGSTYQVYMSGNVGKTNANNWKAAATQTLTVGAPVPTSLTPNQAGATATTIPLAWAGTQGEHFRVLRKTGSAPANKDDGMVVYEGADTSATAMGLNAGTKYFFAVYGKVPNVASYSATAVQASAGTTPANPTALSAMATSSSEIALAWNGTSAEFRVVRKTGSAPMTPADGTAVYEGALKAFNDINLNAGTQYFYRVWGKTAGTQAYSAASQQANATTTAMPTDRHVADDGNDQGGANPCTAMASPCRSITRAMAAAGSGDSIYVQPGTYSAAGGEVFPITFKSGVRLLATGSPADTFIDGTGDPVHQGMFEQSQNISSQTRLEGFTIRNALRTVPLGYVAFGGAVYVEYGQPGSLFTITGNVFENNEARGHSANDVGGNTGGSAWGGAIGSFSAIMAVTNNVFSGNIARGGNGIDHPETPVDFNENGGGASGGAIFFGGTGTIGNNTFVGNVAQGGNGGLASDGRGDAGPGNGGAIDAGGDPAPAIINNIFVHNAATPGLGSTPDDSLDGAISAPQATVDDNLFFENEVAGQPDEGGSTGANAQQADPRFHSPSVLRLRNSSPANGAATSGTAPAVDFEQTPRPDPPSLGAYEASTLAQSIQFGAAPVVSVGGSDDVAVMAGASSSPLILTVSTPATCSVDNLVVTGVSAGACTLLANQAADVDYFAAPQASLTFQVLAQPTRVLSVTLSGAGSGSVSSSPAGIECGNECEANFANNSVVTLVAMPHAGSVFAGWSGACTGTGACQVTMSQARSVGAQFLPDANAALRVFVDGFED